MKIGDEVYVHGYIDEIRQDTVIIRNDGGYFGTVPSELVEKTLNKDLISRQNTLDALYDRGSNMTALGEKLTMRWLVIQKCIEQLPSAEPKIGTWVKKEHLVPLARDADPLDWDKYDKKTHSELKEYWHCSECDYEGDRHFRPLWNYCPNCGERKGSDEE